MKRDQLNYKINRTNRVGETSDEFHRSFRPLTPPSVRFTYWAVSLILNNNKNTYHITQF